MDAVSNMLPSSRSRRPVRLRKEDYDVNGDSNGYRVVNCGAMARLDFARVGCARRCSRLHCLLLVITFFYSSMPLVGPLVLENRSFRLFSPASAQPSSESIRGTRSDAVLHSPRKSPSLVLFRYAPLSY